MRPSSVPIKKLLYDDKLAYVQEGHGGKPVWQWPIFRFFKLYADGKTTEAEKAFAEWYIDQFQKYGQLEKSKGGMKGGSLSRLYDNMLHHSDGQVSFQQAVAERVRLRFSLFDKIKSEGYLANPYKPVIAFKRNDDKLLMHEGHHRVAILAALGYDSIPNVHIFRNKHELFLFRLMNRFRKLIVRA